MSIAYVSLLLIRIRNMYCKFSDKIYFIKKSVHFKGLPWTNFVFRTTLSTSKSLKFRLSIQRANITTTQPHQSLIFQSILTLSLCLQYSLHANFFAQFCVNHWGQYLRTTSRKLFRLTTQNSEPIYLKTTDRKKNCLLKIAYFFRLKSLQDSRQ